MKGFIAYCLWLTAAVEAMVGNVFIRMDDHSPLPYGFLECNGQSVSKEAYPELFELVKCKYGCNGNTFEVPDLRGEFIRGVDDGRRLDSEYSSRGGVGSIQEFSTAIPFGGLHLTHADPHYHTGIT